MQAPMVMGTAEKTSSRVRRRQPSGSCSAPTAALYAWGLKKSQSAAMYSRAAASAMEVPSKAPAAPMA